MWSKRKKPISFETKKKRVLFFGTPNERPVSSPFCLVFRKNPRFFFWTPLQRTPLQHPFNKCKVFMVSSFQWWCSRTDIIITILFQHPNASFFLQNSIKKPLISSLFPLLVQSGALFRLFFFVKKTPLLNFRSIFDWKHFSIRFMRKRHEILKEARGNEADSLTEQKEEQRERPMFPLPDCGKQNGRANAALERQYSFFMQTYSLKGASKNILRTCTFYRNRSKPWGEFL